MARVTIFDILGTDIPPSQLRRYFCNHCGALGPDCPTAGWECADCGRLNPKGEPEPVEYAAKPLT